MKWVITAYVLLQFWYFFNNFVQNILIGISRSLAEVKKYNETRKIISVDKYSKKKNKTKKNFT